MQILLEGRPIPLTVRRHRSTRRITLRLSAARDGIILTLPRRTSIHAAMAFFHSKSTWILEHVAANAAIAFIDGAVLPVMGVPCMVRNATGRGVSRMEAVDGETLLYVHGDPAFTARRVLDFLKKRLLAHCTGRARAMADDIGRKVNGVRLRDMRSCWGTCSAKGALSFNWRLVFAPPDVLEYLIAHEVAHLAEMNHSARFWNLVARLCPHVQASRRWLKKEGHRLHLYG